MSFRRPNIKSEVVLLESQEPTVKIEYDALLEMKAYVDECDSEVGWLGRVETIQGVLHITKVYLFEQEVDGTTTEISPEGLHDFAEELLEEPNGMEKWNQIRVWGHSHVNMPTSPSGQDDEQMLEFMKAGHPYFLRLITNKEGEVRLDYYDYLNKIAYKNIDWEINYPLEIQEYVKQMQELEDKFNQFRDHLIESIQEKVKPEIRALVTEKVHKKAYPWTNKKFERREDVYHLWRGGFDEQW